MPHKIRMKTIFAFSDIHEGTIPPRLLAVAEESDYVFFLGDGAARMGDLALHKGFFAVKGNCDYLPLPEETHPRAPLRREDGPALPRPARRGTRVLPRLFRTHPHRGDSGTRRRHPRQPGLSHSPLLRHTDLRLHLHNRRTGVYEDRPRPVTPVPARFFPAPRSQKTRRQHPLANTSYRCISALSNRCKTYNVLLVAAFDYDKTAVLFIKNRRLTLCFVIYPPATGFGSF